MNTIIQEDWMGEEGLIDALEDLESELSELKGSFADALEDYQDELDELRKKIGKHHLNKLFNTIKNKV